MEQGRSTGIRIREQATSLIAYQGDDLFDPLLQSESCGAVFKTGYNTKAAEKEIVEGICKKFHIGPVVDFMVLCSIDKVRNI